MSFTTLVTPEEVFAHVDDPGWVILDCRFSLADAEHGRRERDASRRMVSDWELARGFERYARWLDHEKAAQQEMLAMVQEHCPETHEWTRWPVFWAYVEPGSSQETVRFNIEHRGRPPGTESPNADNNRKDGRQPHAAA